MNRQPINPPELFNSMQYGFSQGLVVSLGEHRRVLMSGQVGVDRDERTVEGGVGAQTEAAIKNMATLLKAAGGLLSQVVMLRIYIDARARDDQQAIADALLKYFPDDPPPSSWVLVSGLSEPDWLIEIEAEAVIPGRGT